MNRDPDMRNYERDRLPLVPVWVKFAGAVLVSAAIFWGLWAIAVALSPF